MGRQARAGSGISARSAVADSGNERAVNERIDRRYHTGCDVITTRDAPIHVSGHGQSVVVEV